MSATGLSFSQAKRPGQSGPPFVPASANNGLSVSPAGKIVWGNDVAEAGDPGQLISNRAMKMDAFSMTFDKQGSSIVLGNAAVAPFFVFATIDGQFNPVAGQNLSAGGNAHCFYSVFNNAGNSFAMTKTSTTYGGGFGTVPDMGLLFSKSLGGNTSTMGFLTEAGYFWGLVGSVTGNLSSHIQMQMFQNGNLRLQPNGPAEADSGDRFQVNGTSLLAGNVSVSKTGVNAIVTINNSNNTNALQLSSNDGAGNVSISSSAGGRVVIGGIGIATGNPGSGSGDWKLGQVQAGAVALDAANYVEVSIGGVIVKLLKAL